MNRRRFMQQSAATAAGVAISNFALPQILLRQKKDKLGVALVGLGYYPAMECGRNEAIPKIGRLLRPIAQILAGARKDVSLFCVSPVINLKSIQFEQ